MPPSRDLTRCVSNLKGCLSELERYDRIHCYLDIIFTVLCVLYYAAMIAKDLYDAKGHKKSNEEEIDVGDLKDNVSAKVIETEKGFKIDGKEHVTVVPDKPDEDSKRRKDSVKELKEKLDKNMEEAHATFSDPANSAELQRLIIQNGLASFAFFPHFPMSAISTANVLDMSHFCYMTFDGPYGLAG